MNPSDIAEADLVTLPSAHSATETVERLKALLSQKMIQVFADIDHAVAAQQVGLTLRTTRDRLIPYCLFTDPQLARVGLSESEARNRGVAVRVARLPMAAVFRAQTTGETRGFMKALIDAWSDRILGFTMFGPEAGEVMAVVQAAMLAGMPYAGLRDAILAHPTMAEGLRALFAGVPSSPAG